MLTGRRILLGVTGSSAAYKGVELLRQLTKRGPEVQVMMTEAVTEQGIGDCLRSVAFSES